jgi:hypothetical protein
MNLTSRLTRAALPIAALSAIGIGIGAGPTAAATQRAATTVTTYRYAAFPYYTQTPNSPGAPYRLYSIEAGATAHTSVYRLTLASGHLRQLKISAPKPWKLYAVEVSPNGKTLAVSLLVSPHKGGLVRRVGLASANGGTLHVIKDQWSAGQRSADPHGLTQPFFAPDSRTILASYTTRKDTAGLVRVTVSTRAYHALSGGKGLVSGPSL